MKPGSSVEAAALLIFHSGCYSYLCIVSLKCVTTNPLFMPLIPSLLPGLLPSITHGQILNAQAHKTKLWKLPDMYTWQSLVIAGNVAWRMLISWTGFEFVWPCVGQKEPWDTETQQNWHWKKKLKKCRREGRMERRSVAGRGKWRETNIWYHLEAALYTRLLKKTWKKWRRGERGPNGWRDKWMVGEAGFGEQES